MSAFYLQTDGDELSVTCIKNLERAMENFVDADIPLAVEVVFVDEQEIRSLNAQTRGVDKVTDVLSFPNLDDIRGIEIKSENFPYDLDEEGNLFLGSIIICEQRAKEQAIEYGHSIKREKYYLAVHGMCHLLGYDHMNDTDKAQMREKEERILKILGAER